MFLRFFEDKQLQSNGGIDYSEHKKQGVKIGKLFVLHKEMKKHLEIVPNLSTFVQTLGQPTEVLFRLTKSTDNVCPIVEH